MIKYNKEKLLNGRWKFKTDSEGLGDYYPRLVVRFFQKDCKYFDTDYDDRDWEEIKVPACWQSEGYDYNGIAWYRTRFVYSPDEQNNVVRLFFKGVDYFADVWCNGYYLGSHEGFFNHFYCDVSQYLRNGENLLVVRVESPNDTNVKVRPYEKTLIKGALQDVDINDLTVNPGGIYDDVKLLFSRDIYIERLKISTFLDLNEKEAKILCKINLVNTTVKRKEVDLEVLLCPANFSGKEIRIKRTELLAPGPSEKDLWISVNEPVLWWPWDMGEPNLYKIDLRVTEKNRLLDRVAERIGIRDLHKKDGDWICFINGKRIFFRGTNYLSDQLISNMNREKYEIDVGLMVEANMNMVRPFCVVEKEEFYDICDEMGVLIYQDFPIQWVMSNSSDLVRRALPQARDMINQLYNHPSIIIWCYGSEPSPDNFEKLGMALSSASAREDPYRFVQQGNGISEWKDLKDKYNWPIDFHFYCGWYPPETIESAFEREPGLTVEDTMEDLRIVNKQLLQFVTEYGSQSLPELASLKKFISAEDRWPPNWRIYKNHCMQEEFVLQRVGNPDSLEEMIEKSQEYQALQLKYHTEFYRRHKFNPCNGALQFIFNDCWPSISWSIVDYYRKKKKGYYALKHAFNPLYIMMDWPYLAGEKAGGTFSKSVYIVNDYQYEYKALLVKWLILDSTNNALESKELSCSVPANSLTSVDEICWEVPKGACNYRIRLELRDSKELKSFNEYIFKAV